MKKLPILAVLSAVVMLMVSCTTAPAPTPTPAPPPVSKETAKPAAPAPAPTKPAATARPLEKVRIMVPSRMSGRMEFFMGVEKGIFKEQGLDAEITVLAANLSVAALENGDVDYITAADQAQNAVVKGDEPVRMVMEIKSNNSWRIFLSPGTASAKDLEGKPLGLNSRGGMNQIATEAALKSLGVDPSKSSLVIIPEYASVMASLKNNAVAGASLSTPQSYLAAADGFKEVADTRNIMQLQSSGLATTVKRMQQNPDQVKRVMKAIFNSIAYIKSHQDEAVQWLTKEFALDKAIAEKVLAEEIAFRDLDGTVSEKGMANYVEVLKKQEGFQNTTLEALKKSVDQTLLKEVQKELGLVR